MSKGYKTKADFDEERSQLIAECEKALEAHADEIRKLHEWNKELKAEIEDLKAKPGTGLYLAKSSTFDVYIAADSFAAAEKAFETRQKGKTLESLAKISDSFLADI